jgi:signal transduction histidine kinase
MVGDLLEMSRADAGSEVFLEDVNVSELVQRSVEAGAASVASLDGREGTEGNGQAPPVVHVDPAVRDWRVGVDKRRFERVMVNLMENAANYGGGATDITVRPGPVGGDVEVVVDDAGPGIDPAERSKVFERFYRGSASGRRGAGTGTGLGLSLVAEHMHAMRGRVRVETSPAGGARFVVALPVLPADGEEPGVDGEAAENERVGAGEDVREDVHEGVSEEMLE